MDNRPTGYRAASMLLEQDPAVTALFAANDVMAVGALGAARDAGLAVPSDLSVIGYDDTSLASIRHIGLSTVDDRSYDVGREAGDLLVERLATGRGDRMAPVRRTLRPRLILRRTTAAPGRSRTEM